LNKFELTMDSVNAYSIIKQKFQISKKQFYYLRHKLHSAEPSTILFDQLREKDFIVEHSKWIEGHPLPNILFVMSPQMLRNYQIFGDAVSFDITYKCCSNYIINSKGKE